MDDPASRPKFVLGIVFLGASRWPPQIVIRYPPMTLAEELSHPTWLSELLATAPWIVLVLFLWFYIYRHLIKTQRRKDELRKAQERVAELEQKLNQGHGANDPLAGGG